MAGGKKNPTIDAGRRTVWRVITFQIIAATVLILIFGLTMSVQGSGTALAGAGIAVVPNALFAMLAFRVNGARFAPNVVRFFFVAEAVKWLSTIVLLIVAFIFLTGPWLPLLVTLFVLLHLQWIAPVFLKSKIN